MLTILAERGLELSRDDFETAELELLDEIGWLVHPPTPMQFVEECVGFVREASALDRCGLVVSTRLLCEQQLHSGAVTKRASAVGVAAIVCSLEFSESGSRVARFISDVRNIPGFENVSDTDEFIDSCRYFRDLWRLYFTPQYHGASLSGLDTTIAALAGSVIEEDLTGCESSNMTAQKREC